MRGEWDLKLKVVNVDSHGCILFVNMQSFVRRTCRHITETERERGKTELVLSVCVEGRTRGQIGNGEARVRGKNTWFMINVPTLITTVQRHHDASLKTELQCGLS